MRGIFTETEFGRPIPEDEHAVSVCLPKYQDNVDYEEGKFKLDIGYPRFVMHKYASQLCNGKVVFEHLYYAELCKEYCNVDFESFKYNNTTLFKMKEDTEKVKSFWQHTGLGISSRAAENILKTMESIDGSMEIKEKIANYIKSDVNDIYLFQSGMTAIFMAFLITKGPFVMLGFPYVDTFKVLKKYGNCTFVTSLKELKQLESISTIFLEFPSNPLLDLIDLKELQQIANQKNAIIVLDDTITTFYNADLTPYCDILVTSLTKSFSGYGNVCAGSLCFSSYSPFKTELKSILDSKLNSISCLHPAESIQLASNCQDYEERLEKMSINSNLFKNWLKTTSLVYYHPNDMWNTYCKNSCHLFSIEFPTEQQAIIFYDSLQINKGPSLGNWCTLVCPYTILAHYFELEWANSYGVKRHLLRISIGCENNLIDVFKAAYNKVNL